MAAMTIGTLSRRTGLAFTEAALGRSLIGGNEQPVFLVVLAAAVVFEVGWRLARGSNAVGCWGGSGSAGCGGRGRITNDPSHGGSG